ncbi:GntR family transcriptional regulator [Anaerotignum sp. MB30-C6]|uniref:GntR family transcriptional regulator n=1 Tax=Anaerotignum sp. MB30-C6 TaxID=3070814 RepID=UPI0027DE629A|nr:GntR family transcriptional regulator [Anaerotignum sp. MB30-C6]WMI80531.1 GntR family transcriptional regulator [Anaerotignum sp. MB30-C6]
MKTIRNRKELFSEILKSFYQGKYVKGEKFMTQMEAKEYYQVARPTVEKVYKMLQDEGFLISKRHLGSIVTFDLNNEEHMSKVPLYKNNPEVQDFYTYHFPILALSRGIHEGLRCSNQQQLEEIKKETLMLLQSLEMEKKINSLVFSWCIKVISNIENPFLKNILEHYLNRVIYFNNKKNMTQEEKVNFKRNLRKYFSNLFESPITRDYDEFFVEFKAFYDVVFHTPEALLFSKIDMNSQIFYEDSQYSKLIHALLVSIHSKGMKKGDVLPTIAEICKLYNVSEKTARNAYDVLAKVGLIIRRQRTGTILVAQLNDEKIREWTARDFKAQKVGLYYTLETLKILGKDFLSFETKKLPKYVIEDMKAELYNQHHDAIHTNAPYFVTDILLTPIIMYLPTGVLQKYYFYVHKSSAEFVNICGLELWFRIEKNEEVYALIIKAIEALDEGDAEGFADYGFQALQLNTNIIMQTCEEGLRIGAKK